MWPKLLLKSGRPVVAKLALGFILILSLCLRVYHIDLVKNPDELNIIKRAVKIADGTWHIQWYNWPAQSLMRLDAISFKAAQVYLNFSRGEAFSVRQWFEVDARPFTILARLLTVAFAVVSVYVVYRIGLELHTRPVGLLAAALLAVNSLHTVHSKLATPDVPMTAALLVNIYIALRLYKNKGQGIWWMVASGAVVGFAVATKYTGVLAALPIGLAYGLLLLQPGPKKIVMRRLIQSLLAFMVSAIVMHTIFNPFFLSDIQLIIKDVLFEAKGERLGRDWGTQSWPLWLNLRYYLVGSFGWNGLIVSLLAYVMVLISLIHIRQPRWQPISLIALFTLIVLGGLTSLGLHWSRWAVPLSPMIALLAAVSCIALRRSALTTAMISSLMVLAIIPQFIVNIGEAQAYTKLGSVDKMAKYIQHNLPPGTIIVADTYYLTLPAEYDLSRPLIQLYDHDIDYYQARGVDYLIIRPERLVAAAEQPQEYTHFIAFSDDLQSHATFVVEYGGSCTSVLNHKRDDELYWYVLTAGRKNFNFACKSGKKLQLYKLSTGY